MVYGAVRNRKLPVVEWIAVYHTHKHVIIEEERGKGREGKCWSERERERTKGRKREIEKENREGERVKFSGPAIIALKQRKERKTQDCVLQSGPPNTLHQYAK